MALVVNDRVKETSTTTGTGTLTLAGAVTGFETFSSAIGNTNTTYYAIVAQNGEFEVGLGTVAAGTLARTTIISSSNSDSAVNLPAGTKDVFCTLPASKSVILDASGNIVANNGSNLTNLNATALASGTVANARLDAQLQDVAGLATTAGKIIQGDGSNFGLSAYTLPTSDGSASQVLTTDGSGAVTFATPTVGDITAVTAGTNLSGGGSSGDVTINLADASTSAKGAASFSSDNFAASSGAITVKDAGIATAELQDDAVTTAKITDANVTTAKIADVNVTEGKIADNAVTLAKMASGTDGNIISYDASGNPVAIATGSSGQVLTSAGAGAQPSFQTPTVGDITAVTAGTNLTGGGSSGDVTINLADASTSAKGAASFSSDNFAASSGAITIKDLGVATAEIQNDAVTQAKIGDDAVGADQLAANAVVTASIVNDNVTQAKIADDAVGADQLASDAVVTASIVDANVTTAKVADDAITLAKMASGTDGNLITYDTSGNPAAVATGSSGQVLTSAGAGAVPSFQTIAAAAITSTANGANNRVATYSDADSLNGEANLTFDGSTLTVTGDIVPGTNDSFDLGASGNVWRDIYTGDLHLTNEAKEQGNAVDGTKGNWTIQEGEESLFILNNKSGKKYRFKLEEM
jgi:hypothetical protein